MKRLIGAGLAAMGLAAVVGFAVPALSEPLGHAATPTTVTLPGAPGTIGSNHDGEPGIAAAPDGTLWATAFNVHDDRPDSQDVWSSPDGIHWKWVAAPFNLVPGQRALGGNDADIAVATAPNLLGRNNVYVAGLWVAASPGGLPFGDISLAVSPDGGATWVVHPLAGEFPGDDRPWVVADGACRVDLVYHAGPTVANVVNVYDLCDPTATVQGLTLTPITSTRYPGLAVPAATGQGATYVTTGFGKPVLHDSVLYIPAMDCPGLTLSQEVARAEALQSDCPSGKAQVYVEVGTPAVPGGPPVNWTLDLVANSDNSAVAVWPATMAVDHSGELYVAWHDNHNSYVSWASDPSGPWSEQQVNPAGTTAVYPTIVADRRGTVRVAWYGTAVAGNANDSSAMGPPGGTTPASAVWSLEYASVRISGTVAQVGSPVSVEAVHRGALCTKGDTCPGDGSRSLFDDFGLVHAGRTGDVAVFTSDQPGGGFVGDHVDSAVLSGATRDGDRH